MYMHNASIYFLNKVTFYTSVQKFEVVKFFLHIFEKGFVCLPRLFLFDPENTVICEILLQFEITVFHFIIFTSCNGKAEFCAA